MTVAVILAAYQARDAWLWQCLSSILASAMHAPELAVTLRLGVDGCPETAALLEAMRREYFWTPTNVGTYVLRNSLIGLGRADAYVIFDADDVMQPAFLPTVARGLLTHAIVGPSRLDVDAELRPLTFHAYRHGVCAFRHEVLTTLGGYQAERLGADADFIARARASRIRPHITSEACYLRRRHDASLTKAPLTGFGTAAREQARKRMERLRLGGKVYVRPVTAPLEHCDPTNGKAGQS